jgi:D-3-phosphoglycerate dehydrogenase
MTQLKILLTHAPDALANYYGSRALAELRELAQVQINPDSADWTVQSLAEAAQGCDIIVSDRRALGSAELFERLPRLIAYCRCAVDIRNVDLAAASARGILVTQASAGFMASVSEWIVGAMIELNRGIGASAARYRAGDLPVAAMGRELRGATLGIIGYGQIGRYLAALAPALGMFVLVADPHVSVGSPGLRQVSLDELLAQSDHVVCLAKASAETENLMDAAAFARMKPGACFINASRGDLVDEGALLQALDAGKIAGCALDVGRASDQMPSLALARHPRVVATPHIGGLTLPAIEHQSMETVRQVADIAQGRVPQGAVNAEQASRWRAWLGGAGPGG